MKIVVAIDSFKGSMTSIEAGKIICDAAVKVFRDVEVIVKPLADGGEGTVDSLIDGLGAQKVEISVSDPLNRNFDTYYGFLPGRSLAVMEMASASGLTLINDADRDPYSATTYGVGEMILDALNKNVEDIIIGLGGSATNDGGMGMLSALGVRFFDDAGVVLHGCAKNLGKVRKIDISKMDSRLKKCRFMLACDVNNPLIGSNGATFVYGPQKGLKESDLEMIDNEMRIYASLVVDTLKKDVIMYPGSGAAGGLGYAFLSFLNSQLISGIELVAETTKLESDIIDADLVITGEGQLDKQTSMGKAPIGVAKLAKKYNIPVIAFSGAVTSDAIACNDAGIDAFFPILRHITTLDDALKKEQASQNLFDTAIQVFRLMKLGYSS